MLRLTLLTVLPPHLTGEPLRAKPPPGTPLPTPTLHPGKCSNSFSKALNTEILSAAVGLPLVPTLLPGGSSLRDRRCPSMANTKFFWKKLKHTHNQKKKKKTQERESTNSCVGKMERSDLLRNELMTNLENTEKKSLKTLPSNKCLFVFFPLFVSLPTSPHFKGLFEPPCLWKNGFSPCLGTWRLPAVQPCPGCAQPQAGNGEKSLEAGRHPSLLPELSIFSGQVTSPHSQLGVRKVSVTESGLAISGGKGWTGLGKKTHKKTTYI